MKVHVLLGAEGRERIESKTKRKDNALSLELTRTINDKKVGALLDKV